MIKVLLADDQPLFTEGIQLMLNAVEGIEVIGISYNGVQAIRLAEAYDPDVILMDIEMPIMNGIEATKIIVKEMGLKSRIILLTTFDHDEYIIHGLQLGAIGYLLKAGNQNDLIEAIRQASVGNAWIDPAISSKMLSFINRVPATRLGTSNPLNSRDQTILRLVASGTNNRDIGERLGYAEGTVKRYVSDVLAKLGAADRAHAVAIAKDRGLI